MNLCAKLATTSDVIMDILTNPCKKKPIDANHHPGMRWCVPCKMLHPNEMFRPDNKRRFTCIQRLRAEKRQGTLGTHQKRAFNCLRCRARKDQAKFGQEKLAINRKIVTALLSEDQMANYSKYCIVPLHPHKTLSAENAIVVTTHQRCYILSRWNASRDVTEYGQALQFITGRKDQVTPGATISGLAENNECPPHE